MKIIGVAGLARSGKDTVGDYLIKEHGFIQKALAYPIKEMVIALLEINHEWLEENKDLYLPNYGATPRKMMQTLGTEWGRNTISEDIWINYLLADIHDDQTHAFTKDKDVVITDVRFENEATAIRKAGGIICHIRRHQAEAVEKHISEAGIEVHGSDFVIKNDRSFSELHTDIGDMLAMYPTLIKLRR
jgi:hypothetical protein